MAGQVSKGGDTSCFHFYTKPPPFYTNSISFTKSPSYKFLSFAKFSFSLSLDQERNPHLLQANPSSQSPQISSISSSNFKDFFKSFNKELQPQPTLPRATPRSTSPSLAPTTCGFGVITSSIGSSSNWTPPCEYLTHQDLDSFLITCIRNSYTLVSRKNPTFKSSRTKSKLSMWNYLLTKSRLLFVYLYR